MSQTPGTPLLRARHRDLLHRHALLRIAMAAVVFVLTTLVVSLRYGHLVSLLTGWNVGGVFLLSIAWSSVFKCDSSLTRDRAAAQDPGRSAVYAIVTVTSAASLLAATVLSRRAQSMEPHEPLVLLGLCLLTVAISWLMTHTSFTLRYAHLYYRETGDREGIGGIEFPGTPRPCYFDFAYLAFTVGMCFQVSDMTISSPMIRRTVLLHGLISFLYNTAIIAFALNLAFGTFG